jgi:hypothetical protein
MVGFLGKLRDRDAGHGASQRARRRKATLLT